jgi:hypothetical protein
MSNSCIHKTFFAVAVALAIGVLSGCGSDNQPPAQEATAPPASAATSEPEQGSEPTTAPEGKDLAPVDVELDDGGFAESTPPAFHVPSGFLVLITAKNASGEQIRLSVSAPSLAQTFKIGPGKTETITLASIGAGESAKMISGGKTIKIVADAEPGP